MFCTKCGNKLKDGEKFCTSCGNKVEQLPVWNADIDATVVLPQNNDKEFETPIFNEQQTQIEAPQQSANQVQPDMPYVMPDTSGLITDTEFLRAPSVPHIIAPPESKVMDEATVIAPPQEETAIAADLEETVIAPKESSYKEDSYNVYSGAVPGVDSQDFKYPTNDNAYPDLPTSIAPQFDDMARQFDEDATVLMGYNPLVAGKQDFDNRQINNPPQSYMPQSHGNHNEHYLYPPQNTYNELPEEPKKKNTAMWIIIACISVIIIAVGATCAVILTQYGSFEDFFASFSESNDDEEDETAEDDDKDNKNKGNKKEEKEEETKMPTTELVTEATTVEVTTLPSTTQKTFDGYCGAQVYYDYNESAQTLVITGFGEMQNYANVVTPWAGKEVRRVEVAEGVTSVTPGAFTEITPDAIYLSSTVASFDVLAVNKFGGIEVSPSNKQYKSENGVLFDKSGTILMAYPNLKVNTSYAIPEGVKIIDEHAFYEATNLNSLSVSSTVEYIDSYAFKGCVNIHRLELPANVTEIRSGVFYGWVESQEIYIANPETKVVNDWNEGCSAEITVGA